MPVAPEAVAWWCRCRASGWCVADYRQQKWDAADFRHVPHQPSTCDTLAHSHRPHFSETPPRQSTPGSDAHGLVIRPTLDQRRDLLKVVQANKRARTIPVKINEYRGFIPTPTNTMAKQNSATITDTIRGIDLYNNGFPFIFLDIDTRFLGLINTCRTNSKTASPATDMNNTTLLLIELPDTFERRSGQSPPRLCRDPALPIL